MTPVFQAMVEGLISEFVGWKLSDQDQKMWCRRLQTFSSERIRTGFEVAHGDWDARGRFGKFTVTDVVKAARNAGPVKDVHSQTVGLIDRECTRNCSYGVVDMEDSNGARFLAHCDCARGVAEINAGSFLGVQGSPGERDKQVAIVGHDVTWFIGRGCRLLYRGAEFAEEELAQIRDEAEDLFHRFEELKHWEARDMARANACHRRKGVAEFELPPSERKNRRGFVLPTFGSVG